MCGILSPDHLDIFFFFFNIFFFQYGNLINPNLNCYKALRFLIDDMPKV